MSAPHSLKFMPCWKCINIYLISLFSLKILCYATILKCPSEALSLNVSFPSCGTILRVMESLNGGAQLMELGQLGKGFWFLAGNAGFYSVAAS